MIIEFVGCTGAGKTTLASEVQRRLAANVQATTPVDFVTDQFGMRRVTNPTVRNLIGDVIGLPFFFRSLYQHRAFVGFAAKSVTRRAGNALLAINYMRSIVRRVGTYEFMRRYKRDRIMLVDEGTVLSSHFLFVFSNNVYSQEDLDEFARLVPLPEIVVFIQVPVDSLVERTLQRSDAPREIRSKSRELIEKYVSRAARMFDELTDTREIRDRVLVVANPAATDDERGVVADRIVKYILDYQSGVGQVASRSAG